uniref:Retrotransposon-like protein 1 (inferred by orthology to a human protein) n=1 Tax=Strongyloides venezuelensis TaxID=75913 RepID=A0A0K0FRX2_STRVS
MTRSSTFAFLINTWRKLFGLQDNMEIPPSTTEWLQNGRLRKTKLAETIKDNMKVLKQTSPEFQNAFWFLTEQTFNAAKNIEDFKHEVVNSNNSLRSTNLHVTSRIKELTNLNMFYDGDIREFISKVETVCDTDEERLQIIPSYLKRITKSAWRSIHDKSDWQIVKEKLINAIDPSLEKKSFLELKNEIIKMTPREKKTGRYFLIRVQEKITIAQEELEKCWSCDEQAELLIKALQNTLYGKILMRKTEENGLDYDQIGDTFLTLGRETYVKKKFSKNESNFKKRTKKRLQKRL